MTSMLSEVVFLSKKRENLLDYGIYKENYNSSMRSFDKLKRTLQQKEEDLRKIPLYNFMVGTQHRAFVAIDLLSTMYSAGHEANELRSFYPAALEYWMLYASYNEAYDESLKNEIERGHPHFALPGKDYNKVNRMLCFGILLGWDGLIPKLIPIVDFNNHEKDGMIERILSYYSENRSVSLNDCVRHLPYFKTLKIFSASEKDRPALMAEYLDDWYHASRREPYYDAHTRDISFWGYWSWEAAAITFLLDIDDSSYASAQFYPKDLVDFARQARKDYAPEGSDPMAPNELRAKAGDPCPKAGLWQSLDVVPELRRYQQNEEMDNLGSVYGLTVWRFTEHEQ
ncbi:PoNe immunity protein domain-containing protein [Janthinobacterium sp. RA13]|uniref:PoNe immunity protein domain-containing protein n=1 Tax=Janthinobacterium sp. RA13 TaxID=1502762 RepID=UPI001376B5C3|nr:PoNe immunity protein domain-containing protein [Janthinobacterium sp. RA13]